MLPYCAGAGWRSQSCAFIASGGASAPGRARGSGSHRLSSTRSCAMTRRRSLWLRCLRTRLALAVGVALLSLSAASAHAADAHGAFIVTALSDTISIERFERSGDRLTGVMLFRLGGLRLDYTLSIAS